MIACKLYKLVLDNILIAVSFVLVVHKYNALVSIVNFCAVWILFFSYKNKPDILKEKIGIAPGIIVAFGVFLSSLLFSSAVLGDWPNIKQSLNIMYYSLPFLLMFFLVKLHDNRIALNNVLIGWSGAIVYSSLYMLYQYVFLNINRPRGLYGHPNQAGSMLDIILPVCFIYFINYLFEQKDKFVDTKVLFFSFSIICGGVCLFLTGARGAIIGVALGFFITGIIYCVKNFNYKKMLLVGCLIASCSGLMLYGLYSMNSNSFSRSYDGERILLLKSSYNMWNDHKWIGVGLRNWKYEYQNNYILPEAKERKLEVPHNIFAYYFSTVGLIGGIGFCLFLGLIFRYLYLNLGSYDMGGLYAFAMMWAVAAITIHGMVECGLTMKSVYRLFCGCLGVTCAMLSRSIRRL